MAGGCLVRLLALPLLVGALYAAWRWDPVVAPHVKEWLGVETEAASEAEPSPELAAETVEHFERFLMEGEGARLELSGPQVSSVLRYIVPELLPPGLSEPRVNLEAGQVRLGGRVARETFPALPDLDQWARLLPDTVPVEMAASVLPFSPGEATLLVRRIEVSGVPLPRALYPSILDALGREDRPGLPPDGMTLSLPDGLRSVYAEEDRLVLEGR